VDKMTAQAISYKG